MRFEGFKKIFSGFFRGFRSGLRAVSLSGDPGRGSSGNGRFRKAYLLANAIIGAAAFLLAFSFAGDLGGTHARTLTPKVEREKAGPVESAAEAIEFDSDVRPRKWTSIVFHHSATERGSARSFDQFHRLKRGWRSLGYHFVIGNGVDVRDGLIEPGPRWRRQEAGAHANSREYNRHGIGICLVGNFEHHPPTDAQVKAAGELARDLCRRFRIPRSRVFGHSHVRGGGSTVCPGRKFPMNAILKYLQSD